MVIYTGLPAPSLIYHYEDERGFLGEDTVIESPVLTGNVKWYVFKPSAIGQKTLQSLEVD